MTVTASPEPRHYSEMNTHRRCPQMWNYRSLRRLTADIDIAPVRDFGSWWHAVRAAFLIDKGQEEESLEYAPNQITVMNEGPFLPWDSTVDDVVDAARSWWETKLDKGQREDWVDTFKVPLDRGLYSLLERWTDRWAQDLAHERTIAVEVPWRRGLKVGDDQVVLEGTADEVVYDTRRSMTMVRDGKTTKDLGQKSALEDMMDSQLMLYAWGLAPTVKRWGLPEITAMSYDRCRSITPVPPQLTKSGRLAVRGGEPSVNGTDLETYQKWAAGPDGNGVWFEGLKKDGSASGFYTAEDKVIEKLSSPASLGNWFRRTRVPLNPNILKTHLLAAVDSSQDIDRTIARVERHGYAQRNLTNNCSYCVFVNLCRAEMIGGAGTYDLADYGLRERTD